MLGPPGPPTLCCKIPVELRGVGRGLFTSARPFFKPVRGLTGGRSFRRETLVRHLLSPGPVTAYHLMVPEDCSLPPVPSSSSGCSRERRVCLGYTWATLSSAPAVSARTIQQEPVWGVFQVNVGTGEREGFPGLAPEPAAVLRCPGCAPTPALQSGQQYPWSPPTPRTVALVRPSSNLAAIGTVCKTPASSRLVTI